MTNDPSVGNEIYFIYFFFFCFQYEKKNKGIYREEQERRKLEYFLLKERGY